MAVDPADVHAKRPVRRAVHAAIVLSGGAVQVSNAAPE
jgi:hypothetical protein